MLKVIVVPTKDKIKVGSVVTTPFGIALVDEVINENYFHINFFRMVGNPFIFQFDGGNIELKDVEHIKLNIMDDSDVDKTFPPLTPDSIKLIVENNGELNNFDIKKFFYEKCNKPEDYLQEWTKIILN